jgi:hypothetical protein
MKEGAVSIQTRAYLHDFADAIKSDNANIAERQMLSNIPNIT